MRKAIIWIHRWLGLLSGLVVLVVCMTGALLVFEKEIRTLTEPYRRVSPKSLPVLPPSRIAAHVTTHTGFMVSSMDYGGTEKSVVCTLRTGERPSRSTLVYVDPYSGAVLHIKDLRRDFFKWALAGHYYFWLPSKPGKLLVSWATLTFSVLLLSGLVVWFPRKRTQLKQGFQVKWRAKRKRLLYDLHNVLGFYSCAVLLILAATGLVYGFSWFADGLYRATSGGQPLPKTERPLSDKEQPSPIANVIDSVFYRHIEPKLYDSGRVQTLHLAEKGTEAVWLYDNPDASTRYRRETRYFDRYTGEELQGDGAGFYASVYAEAAFADRLKRMNYDIHVGSIGGLTTKTLAFLACCVGGLLVVTGYWMWWGRQRKLNQKKQQTR
ncbi:MAG: PepSY domain-containing protein [Parapedobacter sp.]|nr:MAG: PepSY domain-containing protein [Parapedobacter sp.]